MLSKTYHGTMMTAARVQPSARLSPAPAPALGSMRVAGLAPAPRTARNPVRPSTRPARCTAEQVQAVVDCATQCAIQCIAAAPAAPAAHVAHVAQAAPASELWVAVLQWVAVAYLSYTVSGVVRRALCSALDKYRRP